MGEGGEWRKEWRYVEVRLFAQVGEGVGDSTWKCLRSSVGHHPPPLPPCVYLHITANGFLLPFWLCGSENIYTGRLKVLKWLSPSILDTASIKNWMWSGDEVKSLGYKSVSGKELIRLPLPVLVH